MPTYEYECTKCGHAAERFEPMSASTPKQCPECKAAKAFIRRIGCGAGIIFRGSGFYETDYKRKGASNSSSSEPPRPAAAETKTPEPKKDAAATAAAKKD